MFEFFKKKDQVVVVKLHGQISNRQNGVNVKNHADLIKDAFVNKKTKAVILHINSPGGSPSISFEIASLVVKLKKQHKIPVYAYVEEMAASGGYFIACAADKIISNPYAIVGSVGVISGGFGFVDLLKKIGVQRRVYTSGENKNKLDPFSEEKSEDIDKLKTLLEKTHANFINWIETNRPGKISKEFFNGDFWDAETARSLGFIDNILTFTNLTDEISGEFTIVYSSPKRSFYEKLTSSSMEILLDYFGPKISF